MNNYDIKIAVATPTERDDYYTDTVLDGLSELKKDHPGLDFFYPDYYPLVDQYSKFAPKMFRKDCRLPRAQFIAFAKKADLIILSRSRYGTDYDLVDSLNGWHKTIYIDGSETGKDRWRDPNLQYQVIKGTYTGRGAPDKRMQEQCPLYFRREKPYTDNMIPFPLGIETRFRAFFEPNKKKDIDFTCMFGQEDHPITRKYTTELVEEFCKKNGFKGHTKKTYILPIGRGPMSQARYFKIWARTKVGICTGGAGYDTRRFWEILGNNCLIIAENIDLYPIDSKKLHYKRVYQYNNLYDFQYQLTKVANFLRNGYRQEDTEDEYQKIIEEHSTKARVLTILDEARKKGLI